MLYLLAMAGLGAAAFATGYILAAHCALHAC